LSAARHFFSNSTWGAKLHNLASGALEESLDDLGRRFARKARRAAPTA